MTSLTPSSSWSIRPGFIKIILWFLVVSLMFGGLLVVVWLSRTAAGASISNTLSSILALGSVQVWWYVTRAAGLTSYLLMWLSMIWGMAVPSRIFQPVIEGANSYDFHEFLSLLGLGFVGFHVGVLMLDRYLPFSLWQVLIPFVSTYRPFWTGLGVIGFYILLLVTVTFYLRGSIGTRAFRGIHLLSLIGYLAATLHGFFAGTDSALPVTRLIYVLTFLVVIFMTAYWLVFGALARREKAAAEARMIAARRKAQRAVRKLQRLA